MNSDEDERKRTLELVERLYGSKAAEEVREKMKDPENAEKFYTVVGQVRDAHHAAENAKGAEVNEKPRRNS